VMIMTYTVCVSELQNNRYVGFNLEDEGKEHKDMKETVTVEMKKTFRPEFLNRIDETIVFHSLEQKHMKDIVKLMVREVEERMKQQDITFSITERAIEKIAEEGFDPEYGARPLRRSIQRNIEDLLSEEFLKENIKPGKTVKVGLNNKGEFIVLP